VNKSGGNDDKARIVPGRKPVLELLEREPEQVDTVFLRKGLQGKEVSQILDRCREAGLRYRFVPRSNLDELFSGNHQGVAARTTGAEFVELEDLLPSVADSPLPVVLALDQVQDPGNAGVLARTLYALGGAGLMITRDRSAYLGAAAHKASAGALAGLPVCRVVNLARALDAAADAGLTVYGAGGGTGAEDAFFLRPIFPAVLVLGNEEKGLRPNVAKRCASTLAVPLERGFDSLNVAQAGAVLLGLMARAVRLKE
jgi:23S rRNA (guanosine2251-2'-O)-methyltransferase